MSRKLTSSTTSHPSSSGPRLCQSATSFSRGSRRRATTSPTPFARSRRPCREAGEFVVASAASIATAATAAASTERPARSLRRPAVRWGALVSTAAGGETTATPEAETKLQDRRQAAARQRQRHKACEVLDEGAATSVTGRNGTCSQRGRPKVSMSSAEIGRRCWCPRPAGPRTKTFRYCWKLCGVSTRG